MTTERFVTAGGVRTRLVEEGNGPVVLFIHGVGGWAENWRLTLPLVAAAGFHAVACDLPGFGQSARPRGARYFDPDDPYYVRFVRDVLDALEAEAATLVGQSLGGAIAAAFAVSLPERLRKLVLVAPGGFGDAVILGFRFFTLPFVDLLARFSPAPLVHATVSANFRDARRAPAWVYDEALRYSRSGGAGEFVRVLRQVVTLGGQRDDLRSRWYPRADRVRCPILVLWGRQDRVLPSAHAERAREIFPHARVEIIEDAGHLVQLERPEEFHRALLDFLTT